MLKWCLHNNLKFCWKKDINLDMNSKSTGKPKEWQLWLVLYGLMLLQKKRMWWSKDPWESIVSYGMLQDIQLELCRLLKFKKTSKYSMITSKIAGLHYLRVNVKEAQECLFLFKLLGTHMKMKNFLALWNKLKLKLGTKFKPNWTLMLKSIQSLLFEQLIIFNLFKNLLLW